MSRTVKDSTTRYENTHSFKKLWVFFYIFFICWSSYAIIQLTDK